MTVLNDLDRFHLVMDTLDRLPQTGAPGLALKARRQDKLREHKHYIDKNGEDLPEIRNWRWGASNPRPTVVTPPVHPIMPQSTLRPTELLALLALLGLVVLAGGCAAASALPVASMIGSPNAAALEIHNNTDVRLQEKNFIILKNNVVGQSSGFSLLGILTIVPASFTTAMSRLCVQAELESGRPQTMVNLILEKDSLNYILFAIPRTSIRADVIEFIPATATDNQPGSRGENTGSKARQ
jgi:hypothetical protein